MSEEADLMKNFRETSNNKDEENNKVKIDNILIINRNSLKSLS